MRRMDDRIVEIQTGENVRANLISLVAQIKEDKQFPKETKEALEALLPELLESEDAKIRKNTAKLMGYCQNEEFARLLVEAYLREKTLFVRSTYLEALTKYPLAPFAARLSEEKKRLLELPETPENRKHRNEELNALTILLKEQTPGSHEFTREPVLVHALLLADDGARELLYQTLQVPKKRMLAPGVMVQTQQPWELFSSRLFKEILFFIPGISELPSDPVQAARAASASGLLKFLDRLHTGSGAYAYRVSLRGVPEEKKRAFLVNFSGELLRCTQMRLINLPGNYEVELRLIAKKEGGFRVLLKCMRLVDSRFAYRKETIAASIHPVDAAVCMELAAPYLKEGAQVLEPFCGVGTMLVERSKRVPMGTAYAVDTFGEAIEKARGNLRRAGVRCNLIHRNFLDFRHDYLFDEVITNLPYAVRVEDMAHIEHLYRAFFPKAAGHLKENGILAIYTRDAELCASLAQASGFSICLKKRIQERDAADWMIFRKTRKEDEKR